MKVGERAFVLNTQTGEAKELEPPQAGISAETLKKYVEASETSEPVRQFCLELLKKEFRTTRVGKFWVEEVNPAR